MFFIIFISSMLVTVILILHNAWLSDWALNTPSFPMTKLEAKTLDLKSRIQAQQYKLVEEKSHDGTRIHTDSSARHW